MALPAEYLEYRIKPGDNLSVLIGRFYGPRFQSAAYTAQLEQILALNPHIRNPDVIHAGTTLRLMTKPAPTAEHQASPRASSPTAAYHSPLSPAGSPTGLLLLCARTRGARL